MPTKRPRAAAASRLRAPTLNHELLFDHSPQPMWVVDRRTFAFLAVNDAATRHYGYSRQEFLGMTGKDIRPPEEVPAFLARVNAVSSPVEHVGTWRHRKKDGALISVHVTVSDVSFKGRDARLVVVVDVTEQLRTAAALQQVEAKYRALVEHAVEGVFRTSVDGRFLMANDALVGMLGYESPEQLIGERTNLERDHYVVPGERARFRRLLDAQGVVNGFEYQAYRRDGGIVWLRDDVRVVRDGDGTICYEGTVEDVTKSRTRGHFPSHRLSRGVSVTWPGKPCAASAASRVDCDPQRWMTSG